ncbi:MAG: phospholipase D-like domain-containing protein [Methanothrix sp.]|nr:phospholipase D-like domain-containing protein [Methanothrix sp.]
MIWLIFLALAIFSVSIIQLQEGRSKRLQENCRQLQKNLLLWQDKLRKKESSIDQLQRGIAQLLKWKERAFELEEELKRVKQTQDYASAQRLHFLEDYIAKSQKKPNVLFLGTLPSQGRHAFEDELRRMLEDAGFEIVIVSPWIKRQTWNRMKGPLRKFSRRGGKLRVFMRGSESDYSLGLSDNLQEEISDLGGETILVARLHAKIYMIDRKEAIVTSSNLTKGGTESNYEVGIWVNDPVALKEISEFVDDIYRIGAR